MVLPRKFRDILLCVALLGLPVLFLQANLKEPSRLSPVDGLLLRISAPIQSAVTWAVSGVHRCWRRYIYLVGVEKENEKLNSRFLRQQVTLKEAQRELVTLKRYEGLLRFRSTQRVETIGARIIAYDASPFVRALRVRVDRGTPQLQAGLPVVTAEGVVGRVGKVYGSYSDVILAVDPKSRIDVLIQRTGGRGLLSGIDGTNRYVCRIEYLLRKEEAKVGDLVVTSGVAGVFPKNLPVGRISKVTKRSYGLYQEVEVIPAVDYTALEEMLVILAPPPPPVSSAPGVVEPARGLLP